MISHEVGIIAIGRNEGKRLLACLTSLKMETNNVVYVDSGSSDGSSVVARGLGAFVVDLDPTRPFTAARARNEGFMALRALKPDIRFVQFVDGDCTLVQGWLATALAFIKQRNDVAVVCGRRRERYPKMSVYNQLSDYEWNTPIGEATACGGDALVRAEAFEAVSGFRSDLIAGEEPEFCLRLRELGWKIWRLDAEMTQHDMAMYRLSQWWARTVRTGYGMSQVCLLHRASPLGIWRWETARAAFWGGVLPVTICVAALIHPVALAAIMVYLLQLCRIAFRLRPTSTDSWKRALFSVLAKFAEFQGILRFCWRQWRHRPAMLIEYK